MTSQEYLRRQFYRLKNTKYGFSVIIYDGEGNHTNQMELTPNRAVEILTILNERRTDEV